MKLSNDVIEQIQSSDKDKSNTEVGRELGVNRETVAKYRKLKEDIAEQTANALDWTDEMRWFNDKVTQEKEAIQKKPKPTKEEKENLKKLEYLQNLSPKDVKELLNFVAMNKKKEIDKKIWEPWHLKLGIVSDTHLWAAWCALEELQDFYQKAKEWWAECFVHAWDMVDGSSVYHWQQFEQNDVWYEAQLDRVIKDYPNVWLPTYFIWWNHSESYLKWGGADITKSISLLRDDLVNLWFYNAKLKLNWIEIELQHWGGWTSYSQDYKLLKYIDKIKAWEEPDIYVLWHYHTAIHNLHRGIHWFMPASFLKENLLAKRFGLWNIIGWWLVDIEKDKKWEKKVTATFIWY